MHCDLRQLDSFYPLLVALGIQMAMPIVMVLLMDANDGCLPLTRGDVNGNGDGTPFALEMWELEASHHANGDGNAIPSKSLMLGESIFVRGRGRWPWPWPVLGGARGRWPVAGRHRGCGRWPWPVDGGRGGWPVASGRGRGRGRCCVVCVACGRWPWPVAVAGLMLTPIAMVMLMATLMVLVMVIHP